MKVADYRLLVTECAHFNPRLVRSTDLSPRGMYGYERAIEELHIAAERKDTILVFGGGEDVSPALYGEENRISASNPARDAFEMMLFRVAAQLKIPMFGLCRGHQFMAVMTGAKLHQDIRQELGILHGGNHAVVVTHTNNRFLDMFQSSPLGSCEVNSLHHQSVRIDNCGYGSVVAVDWATRQVVEAMVYYDVLGLSVQCHPEMLDWIEPLKFVADTFL